MTTLEAIRTRIVALTNEIDGQYWTFTRSARGRPVDARLTRLRGELERQAKHLQRHCLPEEGFDANGSPAT